MIEYIDALNSPTGFVFTGVMDIKLFKLQVNNTFLNRPNIFIDINNELLKEELSSIYPQIVYIENGEDIDVIIFKENKLSIN